MAVEKRTIEGRDFWFTVEHVYKENPDTGDIIETGKYYCAFSTREPGPMIQGEVLKVDRGRAKLFSTSHEAVEAGIREVRARLSLPSKAYAVNLPYGTKEAEYNAYVNLLHQLGISVDDNSRVEDSFGRKWLHVWDTREEAERFAVQLRQATRDRDWEVYELRPLRPPAGGYDGRSGPIEILIGRQSDGITYSLHPNSLKRIRQQFSQVRPKPSVFIGNDTQANYETSVGPTYDQVAILLTGLSRDKVMELGGYRVVDPISDLVLYEADPAVM
jgi:hypothetical protein